MFKKFRRKLLKRDISAQINQIDEKTFLELRKKNNNITLIDVRSIQEYNEGHRPGAILIQSFEANQKAERILKDKQAILVLYCSTGVRSKKVAEILLKKGYKNVNILEQQKVKENKNVKNIKKIYRKIRKKHLLF